MKPSSCAHRLPTLPESARQSFVFRRTHVTVICTFSTRACHSHQARFSAPVIPGDTITVDLWKDGKNISFEARVKERGATVIKNGLTVLRA